MSRGKFLSQFDLIIFDCDGVLVDSEIISIELLIEMFQSEGFHLSAHEAYQALLGKQVRKASKHIKDELGLDAPEIDFEEFNFEIKERFRKGLRPIPGIKDVLSTLKSKVCVASSSNRERLRTSLSVTDLDQYFGSNVYSADQVAQGKPAPDLFLFAADKMGVSANKCLVIEDSPAGVKAAKTAGMLVVGFEGGSHAEPSNLREQLAKQKPDFLISSMTELPEVIADVRELK